MPRGLIFGIGLWAVLTLGFWLVVQGEVIALSGETLRILLPSSGVVLALGIGLALRIALPPGDAIRFGLRLAIPGMILGSAALVSFGRFVARPSMEFGIVYAIFLLWTYGLVLAAIVLLCDDGAD